MLITTYKEANQLQQSCISFRTETNIQIVWVFAQLRQYLNPHWIFESKLLISCEYMHVHSQFLLVHIVYGVIRLG